MSFSLLTRAEETRTSQDPLSNLAVHSWETQSKLSHYFEDPGPVQLLAQIKEARSQAGEGIEHSYRAVAEMLRLKIFSGNSDRDEAEAGKAENEFRELVKRLGREAVVFVRMNNGDRRPVYPPLGILAAKGDKPVLDRRITVVQPLPRERYPGPQSSVTSWTFGMPQRFNDLDPPYNEKLRAVQASSSNLTFERTLKDLSDFLDTKREPPPGSKPEGILLLAHHADGNLWFDAPATNIPPELIRRRFPPGSVAIVSACSVGGSSGDNAQVLQKLNHNGVDAMIISPFPVPLSFGTMLAVYSVQAIEDSRQTPGGLSLAELFSKAAEATSEYFTREEGSRLDDMSLEFVIAGDYRLRLSPP